MKPTLLLASFLFSCYFFCTAQGEAQSNISSDFVIKYSTVELNNSLINPADHIQFDSISIFTEGYTFSTYTETRYIDTPSTIVVERYKNEQIIQAMRFDAKTYHQSKPRSMKKLEYDSDQKLIRRCLTEYYTATGNVKSIECDTVISRKISLEEAMSMATINLDGGSAVSFRLEAFVKHGIHVAYHQNGKIRSYAMYESGKMEYKYTFDADGELIKIEQSGGEYNLKAKNKRKILNKNNPIKRLRFIRNR